MKKISDEPVCFVVSLKEVKEYGLSALAQLKRNPEAKLLFPRKGKRNVREGFVRGDGKGKAEIQCLQLWVDDARTYRIARIRYDKGKERLRELVTEHKSLMREWLKERLLDGKERF